MLTLFFVAGVERGRIRALVLKGIDEVKERLATTGPYQIVIV